MVWSPEISQGNEAAKCRHRIASFLKGRILDIGCGGEKICTSAIGVDRIPQADIELDLEAPEALNMFADGSFDVVFSSHVLEDLAESRAILEEWWRVVKPGGHIILYGPDPDYYPRIGTTGANTHHKVDLSWKDVWGYIRSFGGAKKIHKSRHNGSNEYSWLLIVKKTRASILKPSTWWPNDNNVEPIAFPRKKVGKKEVLLVRFGALGDAVWSSALVKHLKHLGYYVVYNCTQYSAQVLQHNPNIDEFLIQDPSTLPEDTTARKKYIAEIGEGFDAIIDLCGSVEGKLLPAEGSEAYLKSHAIRHKKCNKNYIDATLAAAGFPRIKGLMPELFFSEEEHRMAEVWRHDRSKYFSILWSLAGSAYHKIYPWTQQVAMEIMKAHDDIVITTVGDGYCRILESWNHSRTDFRSGEYSVRQSMILTGYSDLVIGAETGILNAASCYDTPKIVFLSHSSVENLTKHWKNCTSLHGKAKCYPCHQLHYTNCCPKGAQAGAPLCMENITPDMVRDAIEGYYNAWKQAREEK